VTPPEVIPHTPEAQVAPVPAQAWAQVPQLLMSLVVSTHWPLQ
jgi:hypothetical protein